MLICEFHLNAVWLLTSETTYFNMVVPQIVFSVSEIRRVCDMNSQISDFSRFEKPFKLTSALLRSSENLIYLYLAQISRVRCLLSACFIVISILNYK